MIESIKYAIISDIYVKELHVYVPGNEKELGEFCDLNGITYVPGKDRRSSYRLVDGVFEKAPLTEDLQCNPTDRLFDEQTIEKFENGSHDEVLFVMENEKIIGVVHITDYNKEFINFQFYQAIYAFETMLRRLLLKKKESNQTLLDWMKKEATYDNHWKNRYKQCVPTDPTKLQREERKRRDFGPFQTFYLSDLLHFTVSKGHLSEDFSNNLNAITSIRNWVAHYKDLAFKSSELSQPLYQIKELKDFVKNANLFFRCYEELEGELVDN